jgi:hypothetical protein
MVIIPSFLLILNPGLRLWQYHDAIICNFLQMFLGAQISHEECHKYFCLPKAKTP